MVLFDSLADPALRALAPHARWIDVGKRGFRGVPHGSASRRREHRPGDDQRPAREARAAQARRVVRLKGGDPSVFGRLEEELEALAAAGIESEVVPGVTAAIAAAAATQRPLTRRGSGRSVSPHHRDDARPAASRPAAHADTEVFYMAGKQLGALARRLVAAGWPGRRAGRVVSRAGWPDELASDHTRRQPGQAAMLHAGRPTVVVGRAPGGP